MAICEMKKLSLITHIHDFDKITNDLMWLGAVEITSYDAKIADAEWNGLVSKVDAGDSLAEIDKRLHSLSVAIDFLKPYDTAKKSLFGIKPVLSRADIDSPGEEYGDALKISDDTNRLLKQMNDLKGEENKLESLKASLNPWNNLDISLSLSQTKQSIITLGTIPAAQDAEQTIEKLNESVSIDVTVVSQDDYLTYLALIYHTSDESNALSALSSCNFSKTVFKDIDVTAREKIAESDNRIAQIHKELDALKDKAKEIALNMSKLEKCYDITLAKQLELQTKQRFLQTQSTALIEGYVPTKNVEKFNKIIEKYDCYAEIEDPDLSEENIENIPVLLENNKFADPFEFVIGLYSYPKYNSFDATTIMSIFYFIIFGLMLGDFMYGLILTVGCFAAVKIMKPKKGAKQFYLMFAICGVATMLSGILFGSYFGNLPASIAENWFGAEPGSVNTALIFDPLQNPMGFLGISLAIGVIHLCAGMGVKAYRLIKAGNIFDAVANVGMWYLVFLGLGLAFVASPCIVIALIGALGLIATQGRGEKNIVMRILKGIMSLYDIVAYISDLLSYARILALSLATTVISMVVNLLGTMGGGGVVGFFALIVAIALGHGLNLALNVLGSFVHAARLQYIEFFGKFYEDGGRPFAPVALDAKYNGIAFEQE